ncbi:hypothetical protein L484_015909 [Morus notabilis]|uniref:Mitochondrial import inner membrane translocase subunit Tim21 n=1 Tax=Morus notabilis TaxID=981085 RepID=W9QX29_9ROSA|nr:hypothetical protein L484_015909 [Morus notabilis]
MKKPSPIRVLVSEFGQPSLPPSFVRDGVLLSRIRASPGSRKSAMELWRKKETDFLRILPRRRWWECRAFHSPKSNPDQFVAVLRPGSTKHSSVNTNNVAKVDVLLVATFINKKDISKVEDPFDAPTYNIPETPVTFTEGASYSLIILAGLGIAAAAGYAVFKELIFEPKEYTVFNKALKRIQDDAEVRVRIGYPITGYGQESRNRAARQRIPNRTWTDEDGVEHVEVNFYIRGPHGAGKVFSEMYKDQADKQWKFTYLIVEIKSPSPAQLILESYLPAYAPA